MKFLSDFFILEPAETQEFLEFLQLRPSLSPVFSYPTVLGRGVDSSRVVSLEYIVQRWNEPVAEA